MTRDWRPDSSPRTPFRGTTWRSGAHARRWRTSWADVKARPSVHRLCNGDVLRQIHILNRVEQADAFLHRPLEGLATGDQSRTAGALVDDGRLHRFFQIRLA